MGHVLGFQTLEFLPVLFLLKEGLTEFAQENKFGVRESGCGAT